MTSKSLFSDNVKSHTEIVRAALLEAAPELPAGTHARIMHELEAAGVCSAGGSMSAAAASTEHREVLSPNMACRADSNNKVLVANMHRQLARYGFTDILDRPDDPIDIKKLDKCLANAPAHVRWQVKSNLGVLGLAK